MTIERNELDHVRNYSSTVGSSLPDNLPFHIDSNDMGFAAVLVALFWGIDERWHVVLTKRAPTLSTHPGENAFPGGKMDPADADLEETALREAYEEVGLPSNDVTIIGKLEPTMTRFKISVTPYIGIIDLESMKGLTGNPAEVSEIFSAPLEMFLSKATFQYYDYTRSSEPHCSLRIAADRAFSKGMPGSTLEGKKIAIIGYGVMGSSILKGLVASGQVSWDSLRATTIPGMLKESQEQYPELHFCLDNLETIEWADIILFSLKPKVLTDFLKANSGSEVFRAQGKLFISIAAGVTLSQLGEVIQAPADLVRVMPNIAASVQKSMNIICPAAACSPQGKDLCFELFGSSGRCRGMPEDQFDVATALCGSAPAFFCTIIEGLVAGAISMGIPAALATELATQTMEGTASMILQSGDHPAVLRDRVTTPAGCTIAGLKAMEEGNIRATLTKCVIDCTLKASGKDLNK